MYFYVNICYIISCNSNQFELVSLNPIKLRANLENWNNKKSL